MLLGRQKIAALHVSPAFGDNSTAAVKARMRVRRGQGLRARQKERRMHREFSY